MPLPPGQDPGGFINSLLFRLLIAGEPLVVLNPKEKTLFQSDNRVSFLV